LGGLGKGLKRVGKGGDEKKCIAAASLLPPCTGKKGVDMGVGGRFYIRCLGGDL